MNTARVLLPGQPAKFCELLRDSTIDGLTGGAGSAPGMTSLLDGAPADGGTTVRPGQTVQVQPVARNG